MSDLRKIIIDDQEIEVDGAMTWLRCRGFVIMSV